jgi:hypothetical protein
MSIDTDYDGEKCFPRIKHSHPEPSTLGQQIKRAQKEMKSWTPARRASVILQGGAATAGEFFTSMPGSKHD